MRISEQTPRIENGRLAPTPAQTIGPFFGYNRGHEQAYLPFHNGEHLVPPGSEDAIQLSGVVYDGAGSPIPDAMIEIWQADQHGHISQNTGSLARDGWTFTGWGRATTDATGRYSFSTVSPGVTKEGKPPFIHVVIFARGLLNKLHTRVYLPEYADLLAKDPLMSILSEEERQSLVGTRDARGNLLFDIILQRRNSSDAHHHGGGERAETVFLQFPGMEYPQGEFKAEDHPAGPGRSGGGENS